MSVSSKARGYPNRGSLGRNLESILIFRDLERSQTESGFVARSSTSPTWTTKQPGRIISALRHGGSAGSTERRGKRCAQDVPRHFLICRLVRSAVTIAQRSVARGKPRGETADAWVGSPAREDAAVSQTKRNSLSRDRRVKLAPRGTASLCLSFGRKDSFRSEGAARCESEEQDPRIPPNNPRLPPGKAGRENIIFKYDACSHPLPLSLSLSLSRSYLHYTTVLSRLRYRGARVLPYAQLEL